MVLYSDNNDSAFSATENSNENLEERVLRTKLNAAFHNKVRSLNELCWDLCVDKAGTKLDQKTATCLSNCVDRFLDSTKFIVQRCGQLIQNNQAYRFTDV